MRETDRQTETEREKERGRGTGRQSVEKYQISFVISINMITSYLLYTNLISKATISEIKP